MEGRIITMKNIQRLQVTFSKGVFFFLAFFTLVACVYLINFTVFTDDSMWNISFSGIFKSRSSMYRSVSIATLGRNILPDCPELPPGLQGRVFVNTTKITDWAQIEKYSLNVTTHRGGFAPIDCTARHRVAIVIPYRDRESHLKVLLRHLHPVLQRQQLDYGIYVVEMTQGLPFNRGILMNVGFAEALKQSDYQCVIFHDVDLLPEDDRNLYTCPTVPRHMSTAVDKYDYRLPYLLLFGGVVAIPSNQFKLINGYSNLYFGWGGEDDDFYRRDELLKKIEERQTVDGLSSLKYSLIRLEQKPLFTWILVSVNMSKLAEPINKTATRKGLLPASENTIQRQQQQTQQKQLLNKQMSKSEAKGGKLSHVQKNTELVKQSNLSGSVINGAIIPHFVDWIPSDYDGQIPDYLSKF